MPNKNFGPLEEMTYSGRGIAVGKTPDGHNFIGYTLTGRRPSSQARELLYDKKQGVVRTNVIKEDKRLTRMFRLKSEEELRELKEKIEEGNPALLIYPAIVHPTQNGAEYLIASNGEHTELIYDAVMNNNKIVPVGLMRQAFRDSSSRFDPQNGWVNLTTSEPDPPNHTPRIGACLKGDLAAIHIAKMQDGRDYSITFPIKLEPGKGKMITTYNGGNENPLLPFDGKPFDINANLKSPRGIAENIYRAIGLKNDDDYRVAAAVMMLKDGEVKVNIINRSERGN